MNNHRYTLEPYNGMKSRYHCPECKHRDKTFVRYIDTETGGHIANNVGKCNRKDKCGYHKPPPLETECFFVPFDLLNDYNDKAYQIITTEGPFYLPKSQVYEILEKGCYVAQWFLNEGNNRTNPVFFTNDCKSFSKGEVVTTTRTTTVILKAAPKLVSFIPIQVFKQSLKNYTANNFVKFLYNLFGNEITGKLISKYFIGTSNYWSGANVFWQIDITGKIRTGKIMLYNATTGKRIKEPYNHISWVHKALKLPEYELRQCFFGEQLLQDKTKPIAICESEKTSIIGSVYLPQFIWIAAGSKEGLNLDKCQVLKGRNVTLFPDLNGFEKWSSKAKELPHLANFTVSDLLERKAEQYAKENNIDLAKLKKEGFDLADFLIKYSYNDFISPETDLQPVQTNKPVTALLSNLHNIHSTDVLIAPIATYLSREFKNTSLVYVETTKGKFDLLFDKEGELLQPGNEWLVANIETLFEKNFIPGLMDDKYCYIYSY